MSLRRSIGIAAVAVASATAGWAVGHRGNGAPDSMSAGMAVSSAATVQEPRAAGWAHAAPRSPADGALSAQLGPDAPTTMLRDGSCDSTERDFGIPDVAILERALIDRSESERYAALTQALEAGIDLRAELLQQLSAADPSERVRLLAFTTYVDSVSHDRIQARAALEWGAYSDNPAVQAEAMRRLLELVQFERLLATAPVQGQP